MTFDEWIKKTYGEDADWDEGWNRGDMLEAYLAGYDEATRIAMRTIKEADNENR